MNIVRLFKYLLLNMSNIMAVSGAETSIQERFKTVLEEKSESKFIDKLSSLCKLTNVGNGVARDISGISLWLTGRAAAGQLNELMDKAAVRQFSDREHSQFDYDDFKGVAPKSELVLECLCNVLQHAQNIHDDQTVTYLVKKISPKLLQLISANALKNLWTNPCVTEKSKQASRLLKEFYGVDSYTSLLIVSLNQDESDISSPSSSLFGSYLALVHDQLSKTNWQKNPCSIASFVWILFHMKFPFLSEYLDQVLPLPLNMVDDFNIENKVLGVQCLHHIMTNVSNEELRWYGRAEVVYEALKQQLYTKHVTLIQILHPAVLTVLNIVEKSTTRGPAININRYDDVFKMILVDAEMENNIHLRRALMSHLPTFIDTMGIAVTRHMKRVIRVTSNYLEIYDGPEETSRLNALKLLKSLLLTAWPRVPGHAGTLLKCLLTFLYDVGTDKTVTPQRVKDQMTELATECLLLLKVCDPDCVQPALLGISETDSLEFVKNIALQVYATQDS